MMRDVLNGGFSDAPVQSARAFRALLEAMARPGSIHALAGATPPAPVSPAAGVVLLTLVDATTPLHLAGATDCSAVRDWVTFHTGAPLVSAQAASFSLGRWEALQPINLFAQGRPDYPDRSATLIVEVDRLAPEGARLRGPGIAHECRLTLPEVAPFVANRARFPLGFDAIFTCGAEVAALPRSTRVEEA
ncbi:MAG: phosphonate C-P lyase system protein PhnH [Phaeovulum sp.]|uniref:phosphonate C-P lyase system protein PhnH n=1 Tax=Phaeovulum sp. TaxID=2934796 RepID=UPI002735F55F|nr:phosphonate C-P lyase system protein PhnH [Phaeovulum sp.]MDP3862360.1 phosphonate C-P lyase system protein PhnH [Phaeovulum sp.]